MMLVAAISEANGDFRDWAKLRSILKRANFRSVRGSFHFNTNQFPIQNFYIAKVIKDGGGYVHKITATAFTDHKDRFAPGCAMK